jgi:polyisoprenoid-binding protein YceI
MKKTGMLLVIAMISFSTLIAQKTYVADNEATRIDWKGNKIIGSEHIGTIDLQSVWLSLDEGVITGGEFIVDMKSITDTDLKDETMRAKLEGHLKSDDFFGVEKYPVSKLVITEGTKFTGGTATVMGNLTIKEATHPVSFTVAVSESGAGDMMTYTAAITFDRSLYNVRFGSGKFFSNLGDNAIKDEIMLEIKLRLKTVQ